MLQRNFEFSELNDVIKFNRLRSQMKGTHNFHRKRPHLLPPLPKLQPSEFRPMDPLQPPDLLLMENRLGSPAPRRTDPRESDYVDNTNNGKPIIKIFEACPKESEKLNLKLDLLSEIVDTEENFSLNKRNSNVSEYDVENGHVNASKKQSDCLRDDLLKKLRSNAVLPLKDLKTASDAKIMSMPTRYTPLKPISQDKGLISETYSG